MLRAQTYVSRGRAKGHSWFIASVLVALLAALIVACGSDNDGGEGGNLPTPGPQLSTQGYFEQLKSAFNTLETAMAQAAEAQNPQGLDSISEVLPFVKQSLTNLEQSIPPFINELSALNPPPEVAEAHQRLLTAVRTDYEGISDLAKRVRDANTLSEATAAFEGRRGTLVESRTPCTELQDIAQGLGLGIVLPCDQ